MAVEHVEMTTADGFGRNLALRFLERVNYREIAEHMIADAM